VFLLDVVPVHKSPQFLQDFRIGVGSRKPYPFFILFFRPADCSPVGHKVKGIFGGILDNSKGEFCSFFIFEGLS
jgi:hypothetical protein